MTSERLAEIERKICEHCHHDVCEAFRNLLTALKESQQEIERLKVELRAERDTLQQRVEVAEEVARFCDTERVEALQRRVEALERAKHTLVCVDSSHPNGGGHTLGCRCSCKTCQAREAALRGGETG